MENFPQIAKAEIMEMLERDLIELREIEYLIRYGEHLAELPAKLRRYAALHHPTNYHLVDGANKWMKVSATLKEEKAYADLHWSAANAGKTPTTTLVELCCHELGIEPALMIAAIHGYSEGNLKVHRNSDACLRQGFSNLAQVLYSDFADLGLVFCDPDRDAQVLALQHIIKSTIDEWFDIRSAFHNPLQWAPKDTLLQRMDQLSSAANQPSKAQQADINRQSQEQRSLDKQARHRASQIAGQQQGQGQPDTQKAISKEDEIRRLKDRDFRMQIQILKLGQRVEECRQSSHEVNVVLEEEGFGHWKFSAAQEEQIASEQKVLEELRLGLNQRRQKQAPLCDTMGDDETLGIP